VGAVVITGFVMASQRQSATPPRVVLAEARSVLEDGGRPVLIIDETGRELLGRRLPTRAARLCSASSNDPARAPRC